MNNSLSELYSKKSEYKNLRDSISCAINILSKNNISDNLATAINTLNSSYLVNDQSCKSLNLKNVGESLDMELKNLVLCLNSLTNKIYSLDKEIEEMEAVSAAGL